MISAKETQRSPPDLSLFTRKILLCCAFFLLLQADLLSQEFTPEQLKKLSLEELLNIEVTLVSRQPEKLTEVASAIQVITGKDIKRSSATTLPETMRLAPNLHTAQLVSYAWVTSSRGFNAFFSNKLLVMIDGRTVYTPLFAGVYWDVQNVLLEDINRIEVVSGPGGTLWGANAVNGVINVVTKEAKETQGLYVSGAAGTFLQDFGAIRYGGKIGPNFHYRVYGQRLDYDNTFLPGDQKFTDEWKMSLGGFRTDWDISEESSLMVQGNLYDGTERTIPSKSSVGGQNMTSRFKHAFSEKSNVMIQVYFDRTKRHDGPSTINDELITLDLDFHHLFPVGERHAILWGGGYRFVKDHVRNDPGRGGLLPNKLNMPLYSSFVQDEISLIPDRLVFTAGTKLQHNVYTGVELQPSSRVAWTPLSNQTIWAAASRAIRAPSRVDVDYFIPAEPVPPGTPHVAGGPDFESEKVIAYEIGYRVQPADELTLSLAAFRNRYRDIYSIEPLDDGVTYQFQNGIKGHSKGVEISFLTQPFTSWRIRGGYTYFDKELKNKPGHNFDPAGLGNDPAHQVVLQSMLDLPGNLQLDVMGKYLSKHPQPVIPKYFDCDVRLAWQFKSLEFSAVGRSLFHHRHQEFGQIRIPRNFYGKITWRW